MAGNFPPPIPLVEKAVDKIGYAVIKDTENQIMVRKGLQDVTAADALDFMERVASGEEEAQDSPIVSAEGGTCYAFSCQGDFNKKDDWKADGYRWRHNGRTRIKTRGCMMQKTYYNAFSAPNTVTTEFRRHAHECTNYPGIVVVFYKGQHSAAGRFPHGNRRCDSTPHFRTRPSIIAACKNADGKPSSILKGFANPDTQTNSVESMISVPRNRLQITNVKKYMRRKEAIAKKALEGLRTIATEEDICYELAPGDNLVIAAYDTDRLKRFNAAFTKLPPTDAQFVSFGDSYQYSGFDLSSIVYKYTMDSPEIHLMYMICDNETRITHDTVWQLTCRNVPELATAKNVCLMTKTTELECVTTTFCGLIDRLKSWRDDPCAGVWELQRNACMLWLLSKNYWSVSRSSVNLSRIAKRKLSKNFRGFFGLNEDFDTRLLVRAPEPDEVAAFIDKMLNEEQRRKGPLKRTSTDKSESAVMEAKRLVDRGLVQYNSESGTFLVGDKLVRVVELFPEEKCSCFAPYTCRHILASRYSIGMPLPSGSEAEEEDPKDELISIPRKKRRQCDKEAIVIEISPCEVEDPNPEECLEDVLQSASRSPSSYTGEGITIELLSSPDSKPRTYVL